MTLLEFESADAQQTWRMQPDHVEAQKLGRSTFYSEYSIQVCELKRESRFPK